MGMPGSAASPANIFHAETAGNQYAGQTIILQAQSLESEAKGCTPGRMSLPLSLRSPRPPPRPPEPPPKGGSDPPAAAAGSVTQASSSSSSCQPPPSDEPLAA